ncbi:MAG: hypothetical protein KAV87_50645 [Desulfobacteraceae bacterium]|nr:hypothetical protein [Desulfobacteraceae bacterium]
MKEKILSEKEALGLADKFPEWVGKLLEEPAMGARSVFRWFILTLYARGYEIKKKK